jgi:hypothetical protein
MCHALPEGWVAGRSGPARQPRRAWDMVRELQGEEFRRRDHLPERMEGPRATPRPSRVPPEACRPQEHAGRGPGAVRHPHGPGPAPDFGAGPLRPATREGLVLAMDGWLE